MHDVLSLLAAGVFALGGVPALAGGPGTSGDPAPGGDPPSAEELALTQALEAYLADQDDLRRVELDDESSAVLWSDFPRGTVRETEKRCGQILERLDRALGPRALGLDEAGEELDGAVVHLLMLRDERAYHALCDALGEAAPRLRSYFRSCRDTTGFTLYAPELTVYYHDPLVQQEALPDRAVAHNLVHLELHRRYGLLPLWLAEGIAVAGEEGAWGEVWAPWNLDGFVWASSHGDWRGRDTREAVADTEGELDLLYRYAADPYRDTQARLAFAFATYGLDRDPVAFRTFLDALVVARPAPGPNPVRWSPEPALARAVVLAHFGAEFGEDFTKWWRRPPSWKKKVKPIERD